MNVLIVTIVHPPHDARILHRQAKALVDAGHQVTLAGPWAETGAAPPPWVDTVELPRAWGRRRLRAVAAARRLIRQRRHDADIVLLHDPELLLSVAFLRRPVTVWDVHEDTVAALTDKRWLPPVLRAPLRVAVWASERWAERRLHLLLAEPAYAERFRRPHPVVENVTPVPVDVPPPGDDRVVYVGRIAFGRGAGEMLELGRRLSPTVRVELTGPVDDDVRPALDAAAREGLVTWHGYVPNDEALASVEGALAGLSLLHDEPNYRHSRPTKVVEYMARGLPVVTTPNPQAVELVEGADCGVVVPFEAVDEVVAAVERLRADPRLRTAMGRRGHAAARDEHDWKVHGPRFVAQLETWAGHARA